MVSKKSSKKGPQVEIPGVPGIEVPKALIDAAVEATCDPAKATLAEEARERAKAQKVLHDHELREDIEVSKQITQAILNQVGKPEPHNVDIHTLPPELKRAVLAHLALVEAKEEYDDAVKSLQPPATTPA